MTDRDDRIAAAREHYLNRKVGRPRQTWDDTRKMWIKSDEG